MTVHKHSYLRSKSNLDEKNWKIKYTKLKRVFEKAEYQYTEQTRNYLNVKKNNEILKKKITKLKFERDNLRILCDEKCDSNEELYYKLQRIERRVVGVPNGQYLLKKNNQLQQKLKSLRNSLEKSHVEKYELGPDANLPIHSLMADDIIALVKDKHKIESQNSQLIIELDETSRKNEELTKSVKELWETNEQFRNQRMKDREIMIELDQKENHLGCELNKYQLKNADLENIINEFKLKNAKLQTNVEEYSLKFAKIENQISEIENHQSYPSNSDFHSQVSTLIDENHKSHEKNELLSEKCSVLTSRLSNALDEVMTQRKHNNKLQKELQSESISLREAYGSTSIPRIDSKLYEMSMNYHQPTSDIPHELNFLEQSC